jgi:hypothetical protein
MKEKKINVLYLLGGGHSGSTVLSLILGTAPEVFNVGELKRYHQHFNPSLSSIGENKCMCGASVQECPFWKKVADLSPGTQIFHNPGFKGYFKLFSNFVFPSQKSSPDNDFQLIESSYEVAKTINPTTNFIMDISKSLPRLIHLRSKSNISISTIFLIRDGRGYLNSYRKRHNKGFFRWIFQWVAVNLSSLIFLSITKERFYQLSYEELCRFPEKFITEINQFFDVQIPPNYIEAVNETEFHLRSANPAVLKKKPFTDLDLDEKWKTELSPLQRWVASALIVPFNKIFSV